MIILFIGMGQTGLNLVEFYLNHRFDEHSSFNNSLLFFDTRENPPFEAKIKSLIKSFASKKNCSYQKIAPTELNDEWIKKADEIYLSPAIQPSQIKQSFQSSTTIDLLINKCQTDLDVFFDHLNNQPSIEGKKLTKPKLIAVTGTNGKSSICQFLLELCQSLNLNVKILGNFGDGFLQIFNQKESSKNHNEDVYILELSSFQLFYSKEKDFDISILSNLYPEHLDWHGSYQHYSHSKLKIFNRAKENIYWYCDAINELIDNHLNQKRGINFHSVTEANFQNFAEIGEFIHLDTTEKINFSLAFEAFNKLTINQFNHPNLILEIARKTLVDHKALNFRNQKTTIEGVEWINDSKSTNTHSLIAALDNLVQSYQPVISKPLYFWLIIGGDIKDLKGGNFKDVANWLNHQTKKNKQKNQKATVQLNHISVYGNARELIKRDLNNNSGIKVKCFESLKEAVEDCFISSMQLKNQQNSAIAKVLFSPGCASLSQFKNYAHRGEVFNKTIVELQNNLQ